jgi:hypothetical protein
MYVIKHKLLFLNNLFGNTYWQFGDHVSLNTCWQFSVLLLLSAYVYHPTYIRPQYNKKPTWVDFINNYLIIYTPKVIPWGQTDKQTNKRTDGWTDGRTDKYLLNIQG